MERPFLQQLRQASFQFGRETNWRNSWWWLLESSVRRNTKWSGLFEAHVQFEEGPKYPTYLPLLRQCAVGVDKVRHWTLEQCRITLHCVWPPRRWLQDPSQRLWPNFGLICSCLCLFYMFDWNWYLSSWAVVWRGSHLEMSLWLCMANPQSPKLLVSNQSAFCHRKFWQHVFSNLQTGKVSVFQAPLKIWICSQSPNEFCITFLFPCHLYLHILCAIHGPYICSCHTSPQKNCVYII